MDLVQLEVVDARENDIQLATSTRNVVFDAKDNMGIIRAKVSHLMDGETSESIGEGLDSAVEFFQNSFGIDLIEILHASMNEHRKIAFRNELEFYSQGRKKVFNILLGEKIVNDRCELTDRGLRFFSGTRKSIDFRLNGTFGFGPYYTSEIMTLLDNAYWNFVPHSDEK